MADRAPPTRRHGELTLHAISDGLLRLDGGAMFGTVPKVLWNRVKPADELNRIDLCMTSLLVRRGDLVALVEAGIGRKHTDKRRRIYGIDPVTSIDEELGRLGLRPEDVGEVVVTHLHFDHAGSLTVAGADGRVVPHFPNARVHVHAAELHAARNTHARSRASYLPEDFEPLVEAGLLVAHHEVDYEVAPGIRAELVGGHTPGMSVVHLEGGEDGEVVFVGDLVPTAAHLPVPWIMGFDLDPVRQVELKERLLPRWAEAGAVLAFPHETRYPWARLGRDEHGLPAAEPLDEGWLEPLRAAPWPEPARS